jgi:Fur family ferric uptake transcriptional regulator
MDRHTSQRAAIEAAIRSARRPLSPAEILDLARHDSPTINLATVYRTLKRLSEGGLIRTVELPGEPSRYELAGLPHHHHFKCDECDRVYDVPGKCPAGLADGLPPGFRVRDHEVVLVGTCAYCSPRATPARKAGRPPTQPSSIRRRSSSPE